MADRDHAQPDPARPSAADESVTLSAATGGPVAADPGVSPFVATPPAGATIVDSDDARDLLADPRLRKSERRLLRRALARELVVPNEVSAALAARGSAAEPLGELLVERRALTPAQLGRLVAELDAEGARQDLPGFIVHGELGRGAAGTVLRATQVSLDRTVAIKVLPRKLSASRDAVDRLYAEGRAAAQLEHPNVVRAIDVGQAGACHYFVMEYVEGPTLSDLLRARGPLPEETGLEMASAICDALAHAHARGLVHRDVKPRNIMLGPSDTWKLADLGLARAVADQAAAEREAGHSLGTPFYMAPEQVRGDRDIGPAADLYALAATLYRCLAGRPVFEGMTREEVMRAHVLKNPEPLVEVAPHISEGLSELIGKALAKDPADRYPSADAMLEELNAWKALCVLRRAEASSGER